mmetsp:Transcript_15321/g.53149  ORF Transcript_15321/g.53149 Transcript_15321/m.53149 type:complete len:273 (-) Transcript_15321:818-1636(-)
MLPPRGPRSKRDARVLARAVGEVLAGELVEVRAELRARLRRVDDVVDEAARRGDDGVREAARVLVGLGLLAVGVEVAVEDLHGALGAHDGDLRGRPRVVRVAAEVLRGHDVVGAAVGLARDDRELGHVRLAVGEQQLGAVADDAAVLLLDAREEARDVDERHQRDPERVAEADEARGLDRGVDVEAAGLGLGVVGDDADGPAPEARERRQYVRRVVLGDLQQALLVDDAPHDLAHVVGHVRVVGHEQPQRRVLARRVVVGRDGRRRVRVRRR